MSDGRIEIDTSINTDGLEKGVKKIDTSLKTIAKGGATFAAVTTAVKMTSKAIKDTTEAYKTQAKAETQLEQAAKNNPYLNKASVTQLKEYASYLQSISTVGDEQLLPFMAQLASAGRTQSEIQDIMSAALDVSASGMMSLDSAVQQLNATFSGNVGLMGRQISELKNLTKEELANGKAVEVIKSKFGGMAEEVAKATGSSEQLKNAFGDLKEEIGAGFEKNLTPMRRFFTDLITGWTNSKKAAREYQDAADRAKNGNADATDYGKLLEEEQKQIDYYQKEINDTIALLNDEEALNEKIQASRGYLSKSTFQTVLKNQQAQYELHVKQKQVYADELQIQKDLEAQKELEEQNRQAEAEALAKANELKAEALQRDKDALAFMETNQKALDTRIEQIKLEAKLKGESVDEQEILNAYMQSYIELVTGSDLVTENNPFSQKRLEELTNYANGVKVTSDEFEKLKEALNEITNEGSALDKLKDQLSNLDELASNIDTATDLYTEYAEKRKQLEKQITQLQKEELAKQFENVNSYFNEFNNLTSDITALIRSSNESQTDEELTNLSQQYTDGLISYEEYCDKKQEISKKAADEEYKLKMWEWTSSLLTATANIAEGVSKAIAQGGVAGLITGALVAASGSIQLATITANKPKKYANGGYVGGASNSGDHVPILANSGELVLNRKEQAVINSLVGNGGGGSGGTVVNMPVTIENNTGANVSTQLDPNGLTVIIDDIVNSSMAKGKYTKSMEIANSKTKGASYF